MNALSDKFSHATVEDLMSREVVTIEIASTMAEAAKILDENGISGAPVVDEVGHCIGILSSRDFVRLEKDRESICSVGEYETVHEMVQDAHTGAFQMVSHPYGEVSGHMQKAVQTVQPNASLRRAIEIMTMEEVHRLIVLDETDRPVGVLSSSDVLKAILEFADAAGNENK